MRDATRKLFKQFRKCEAGVTLVEYGIAIVLGVTVGTATLIGLANDIEGELDSACTTISGAVC